MILNFSFYKKLFSFSFYYVNPIISNFKFLNFLYLVRLFKFFFLSKNIKIFLPKNFNIFNNIFISFWKNGFISNFYILRWLLVKRFSLKSLSSILINLTSDEYINSEIKKMNLPLISLSNFTSNIRYDFFINNKEHIIKNNLDNIYFFIFLFTFFKKYKNV